MLPTTGDRVAAERSPHPLRSAAAPDVLPARRPAPTPRAVPVQLPRALPPAPARPGRTPAPNGAAVGTGTSPLPAPEAQGCLYALSQPPLMLFLLVVGGLLGLGAAYDLIFL